MTTTTTTTPDLATLIRLRPSDVAAELQQSIADGEPMFIWGPPGIGKTANSSAVASPEALAAANIVSRTGEPFCDFRVLLAGEMDQTDLSGFPVPDHEARLMRFLKHEAMAAPGPIVLFADELNNASQPVLRTFLRVILEPDAYLPRGSYVFAAGNRPGKDRSGAAVLPSASANRFRHVEMRADREDWENWAIAHNVPAHALGYARFQQDVIEGLADDDAPDLTERAFPSPRSFTRAALGVDKRPQARRLAYLAGNIGATHGIQYHAFLRTFESLPNIDHIFMAPTQAPLPQTSEAYFALAAALPMRATPQNFGAICTYADRCAEEYRIAIFSMTLKLHPALSQSPAAAMFIRNNHHLFN